MQGTRRSPRPADARITRRTGAKPGRCKKFPRLRSKGKADEPAIPRSRSMRARIATAATALAVVTGLSSPSTRATSPADETVRGTPDQHVSTLGDQAELSVTVYNSNIALIRDVRNLRLPGGAFDLQFMDIAATVNPATVHFRSLTEPSRVHVLEQNYEYDLLEPDKLLRKYVGREVTLVRTRQDGGTTRTEEVRARLVSYNTAPVWQIGNEIVTGIGAD